MVWLDYLRALRLFAATRRRFGIGTREELERRQRERLRHFMRQILPRAPYYSRYAGAELRDLPLVDKRVLTERFAEFNTRGITREGALETALAAERSRDFTPAVGDVTVGLSSGTSGQRGVFLVSRSERLMWGAILMARILTPELIRRLVNPWSAPVEVAFFLRADSNLYATLNRGRIAVRWYDLMEGLSGKLEDLQRQNPEVIVAPASVLAALADMQSAGKIGLRPRHIFSVAETLEAGESLRLEEIFGIVSGQIYQATEGFLGCTCPAGNLHLNELFVHIEPMWLDAGKTRFHPIVTDFTRSTQIFARYLLDDVLRTSHRRCPCGSPELVIDAVEGRADEVLVLSGAERENEVTLFPDTVRHCFALAGEVWKEYSLEAGPGGWRIGLLADDMEIARQRLTEEIRALCGTHKAAMPLLEFERWSPGAAGVKRRRIVNRAGKTQAPAAHGEVS